MSLQEQRHPNETLASFLGERGAAAAIKRDGVIEVPVNNNFLSARVMAIQEGMLRMTNDPPEGLVLFPWHDIHTDRYGPKYHQEVGLKTTSPDEDEQKFTFHYSPDMVREFSDGVVAGYEAFFKALHDLDGWSQQVAIAVAETFDIENRRWNNPRKYPGQMVQRLLKGRRIIRVLRYKKPYAQMHIDRSLFTVHPWSSHKGLQFSAPDRRILTVNETGLDTVAVFPGEKFAAATRGVLGYGTPHGVRDERHAEGAQDQDRFAVVCFTHPNADAYDAEWLLGNRHRIEAYERTCAL